MSSQTKIERNAVNIVRDYVDSTACLRSYLRENDRTPLWDGSIFVYEGEPDKNEHFIGTVKTQIKGTEVETFLSQERYRVPADELRIYMREAGLFFFVVEMLKSDISKKKIFYKKLTPHTIMAFLKQAEGNKTVAIKLEPIPSDSRWFEDEMMNFIRDSRKQVSFVEKPSLSLDEALRGGYQLRAEGVACTAVNPSLAMLLTSQPFVLYQETPFASIPVSDVELTARVTEHVKDAVKIGNKTFFPGYTRRYDLKTVTENIGGCFEVSYPKKGYEESVSSQVGVIYPQKGNIQEAINAVEFLKALKYSKSITFGEQVKELKIDEVREKLFKNLDHNYAIYRDIAAMWEQMQIPGVFSFDDFDEKGLQQYLDVVLHVYRKVEGIPMNPVEGTNNYFSPMSAGYLTLLLHFTHLHDKWYASDDAFSVSYIFNNERKYPLLTAALSKSQDILFDNIHYEEQLACYRQCLAENRGFRAVIIHDADEISKRLTLVERKEKRQKVESFLTALKGMVS